MADASVILTKILRIFVNTGPVCGKKWTFETFLLHENILWKCLFFYDNLKDLKVPMTR